MRAAGAAEGVVAVADEQTAGRGRLGRTWVAPAGSALLVSVLLRPHLPAERTHLVTLAAGLAALEAVGELSGADARAQVAQRRRGRRSQARGHPRGGRRRGRGDRRDGFATYGPTRCAEELAPIATAVEVDRGELLAAWLQAYDARLVALDSVVAEAAARSATLGRRVRVELADETFEGTATSLTDEGFLVVDGRVVSAGDVVHLRYG